MYLTFHYAM